jgi:protein TonB
MKKGAKKQKRFVQIPHYEGGKEAFRKFIASHLVYPAEALKEHIEGIVIVEYEVNDNGIVTNARIFKGIGYGCDTEALRLIKLLKFDKTYNRGIRVKSKYKAKIEFKLPISKKQDLQIAYTVKPEKKNSDAKNSYSYSINIKPK